MQLNDARNADNRQKQQSEQNKLELVKKKSSLLKKKKLPPTKLFSNIDLKHVINIGDVCFINQDSLRDPDKSEETLLKALYSYKMISKVTLNNSYLNIQLKKNNENLLPPQYFIERLKSFGDLQMSRIASHLQKINIQFSLIRDSCPLKQQSFVKDREQSLLQNFIERMDEKKYLIYFNQITPQKMTLKNVIFSVPLLQALGCNLKSIAMDFLKYRHVFFQVFTAKNYKFFIDKCMQNFGKIQQQLLVRPDISEQQKQELTAFIYDDQVIRSKQRPEGIYEEISNAKVKWFSPHPSICCFEILSLDEPEGIRVPKLRKINHFEETKPEQEIKELKRIGIDFPLLSTQDESN